MLAASLGAPGSPLRILALGAHCDDIEIGCGGSLLRLLSERPGSSVHYTVFSSTPDRAREAKAAAGEMLAGAARAEVQILSFRESFFPYEGAAIKEQFERLKREVQPDLIFTHRVRDLHQDHRTVAELTWNTFRDHLIAEYEIAKFEGDLGQPGLFVPLTRAQAEQKIGLITRHYASQASRRWFRAGTFEALLRLRGIECNAPEHFAEAFDVRKLVL